ncbi:MAG: hypothetical protein ACPG8W_24640 [Candidatus Promineifilaceae bacterium]
MRDLGSRNGAYINRTKLLADVAEIWENHQTLRLGPYYFRLQIVPRDIKQREVDLELGPTHAEVVLGQSTEVEVILLNHGERRDYLKLRIEGPEASWMTLGQDTVEIMPNERAIVMLKMRPPRLRDELVLQTHPYTLIATSLLRERDPIDGEGQVYVQASHSVHTALFPNSQVNAGTFKLNIRNDGALPLNCQIRSRQPGSTLIFGPWTAEGVVVSAESIALVGAGNLGKRLNEQTQALTQHRIWRGFNRFPGVTQLLSRIRQLSFFRNIQHIEGNVDELRQQGRLAKEATATMTGRSQSAETPTPEREFGLERTRSQQIGVQQDTQARPFMEANLQIASHHEAELRLVVGGVRRPFFGRTSSHPFELELNAPGDAPRLHNATLRIEPRLPMWAFWLTLALLFTGLITGLLFLQPVRVFGLLDTDEDKLRDSVELYAYQTDARSADSDNDGLPDGLEVAVGLDPLQSDTDNDGLLDGQERIDWRNGAPYKPLTPRQLRRFDADGDGKIDGLTTLSLYPSSAFDTDSDSDSFADGLEINTCHDPLRPDQGPVMADRCKRSIPATVNNPPTIKAIAAVTKTFAISASVGAETNATFVLGDNAENVRSTHLLTFDLSQLPRGVRLRDVQLIVTEPTRQGRPANLGLLTIDLMDGNTPQITRLAQLQPDGTSASWQATLTQLIDILPTRNTLTLRLATTLANNKDNRPDQLTFAAANSDSPPRLIVVYEPQGAESE